MSDVKRDDESYVALGKLTEKRLEAQALLRIAVNELQIPLSGLEYGPRSLSAAVDLIRKAEQLWMDSEAQVMKAFPWIVRRPTG